MDKILDTIDNIEDLKKLNNNDQVKLALEIRQFLVDTISKTGGHLASNLGVVELTIALHSVFNVPNDKIIWDVGHQSYVHKILTGRKGDFSKLRQYGGLSGFTNTNESKLDCFNTGHSSTSISIALGMARSEKLLKNNNHIIAVIGDGALTGGMALEALNDAGSSNTNLIVILNDNEMSISKNVGGLSRFLSTLRTRNIYMKSNRHIKNITKKIPYIGKPIISFVRKIKYGIKHLFISNMFFEDIGFSYLGPIDGHDIEKLKWLLNAAKSIEGPILIHVLTKKGKGYKIAEENPGKFHGVSPFEVLTGEPISKSERDYSQVFGQKLLELAKNNEKIVAITAAMRDGTGLKDFSKSFPERFFDVGIAEQHGITMAAGMAKNGLIPIISIYSSFLQRAYDQIIHDICIQNLPVIICIDRAGVVGNDGETHQGVFDLSYLSNIPNLNIMAPKDFKELEDMLEFATNIKLPIAIRYPRGDEGNLKFNIHTPIKFGKAELLEEGKDITILAIGKMVLRAKEVAGKLKEKGISSEVINIRFLKPIDTDKILDSINKTKNVITIEDNLLKGGLASTVLELINNKDVNFKSFGYPDEFIKHGNVVEIEKQYGLDTDSIVKEIMFYYYK